MYEEAKALIGIDNNWVYLSFIISMQAFILGDRKTGVLYIPDMYGPNFDYIKWSKDIYNGIFEIKWAPK